MFRSVLPSRATRSLVLGVACAALAVACGQGPDATQEAVRAGFDAYKNALLERDGKAAARAVSANTLVYYDRMRDLALGGGRDEVEAFHGADRMLILGLRVRAPLALLRDGAPEDVLAFAVDEGMIGAQQVARTDVGDVTFEDDRAHAELLIDGEPAPARFTFRGEGDAWKIDLEAAAALSRDVFKGLAAEQGMNESDLMVQLLSRLAGRPLGAEVWTPPNSL